MKDFYVDCGQLAELDKDTMLCRDCERTAQGDE